MGLSDKFSDGEMRDASTLIDCGRIIGWTEDRILKAAMVIVEADKEADSIIKELFKGEYYGPEQQTSKREQSNGSKDN